jgi:hypothetical protein
LIVADAGRAHALIPSLLLGIDPLAILVRHAAVARGEAASDVLLVLVEPVFVLGLRLLLPATKLFAI